MLLLLKFYHKSPNSQENHETNYRTQLITINQLIKKIVHRLQQAVDGGA